MLESKIVLEKRGSSITPLLGTNEKRRLEQELSIIHTQINKLIDAMEEIRKYLKTTP